MISLLIGTKGYQINKIMRESHTIIVVNQPINKMTYRTVKIQGAHADIAKACRIIYEILEDKSSIAYSIEKEPSQLDYSKARVKTKFLLCSSLVAHLLGKKKAVIKRLEEETRCIVKFKEECTSRIFKQDEELCVLMGRLEDVQAFIGTYSFYFSYAYKYHPNPSR
jgi:polyribonucleotide nucleotidyltransferase